MLYYLFCNEGYHHNVVFLGNLFQCLCATYKSMRENHKNDLIFSDKFNTISESWFLRKENNYNKKRAELLEVVFDGALL